MTKQLSVKDRSLKRRLDAHYRYFDYSQISPDPLEFLHRYKNFYDIEIAGLISSVFAYGNVKQIMNTLEIIHQKIESKPFEFLTGYKIKDGLKLFKDVRHRFFTSEDIAHFFKGLAKIYTAYGSLNYLFLLYYFDKEKNLKNTISCFSNNLADFVSENFKLTPGIQFMFPDPQKGSACKRMNLFLRWMIRNDELDFGLWKDISPDKLVIPVDTHVAKICRELKLTKRKVVSWQMAEEITDYLKKFDPADPVKYDFAICHIGMRKMKF
ncbi:MAG: TIGR02757 family protein [bacterium]